MTGLPSLPEALAKHRDADPALFLDVDGTILDFSETPESVVVPQNLIDTLARLHTKLDGALALISGRALDDLDRLFQPLHLPAAGLHGFHVRGTSDDLSAHDEYAQALAPERTKLHSLFDPDQRILIEDKGPCIAVHFRRAPDVAAAVGDAVHESLSRLGERFEVLSGHMLYELRRPASAKAMRSTCSWNHTRSPGVCRFSSAMTSQMKTASKPSMRLAAFPFASAPPRPTWR